MSAPEIFDQRAVRLRKARVAEGYGAVDFLRRECADRLAERLAELHPADWKPERLLDLGSHHGELAAAVQRHRPAFVPTPMPKPTLAPLWISADTTAAMLRYAPGLRVATAAESLPLADGSVDAALSVMALHWVNDVPGMLRGVWRVLRPGGCLLLSVPGPRTLSELRRAMANAASGDTAQSAGMAARIGPFLDAREGVALLQAAGFAEPVADTELLEVAYGEVAALFSDLRRAGETNALVRRPRTLTAPGTLAAIVAAYEQQFRTVEGHVPATVEIVTLTGWRPA